MKSFRFVLGAALLVASAGALACSSEDRIALAQMGYTGPQIDAQCGSGGNPFVTPSMPAASVCVTRYGYCGLANRVPVGNQCACSAAGGWALGVTR